MARIISLKPGSRVFKGTVEYEIIGSPDLNQIKVKNVATGDESIFSTSEVVSQSSEYQQTPYTPLDCLTEEERKVALDLFKTIKAAISKNMSRSEIEALAKKHGVHFTTIYRRVNKYHETDSPASLLPRTKNQGGKGGHRIDPALDNLIEQHFVEIVNRKEVDITKLAVNPIKKAIERKCKVLGLKPPTWYTIENRLDQFIRNRRLDRKRKRKGGRSRTMAGGMFPDAKWPFDVVQIDHTPLDIIIVDDEFREPIGKPYLSIAIDCNSRVVVGFSLSLDAPSIFSVGRLIAHCILPKEEFLEGIGVDADWGIYGVMGALMMDNAGEFRTEDFIPFQEEYLVDIRWRPVATPEYGGYIERLAKTLNDRIHEEPGSTMGDIIAREGYDSEGHACYTMDSIEKWLTILITKIYHMEKHSALKNRRGELLSPLEKYRLGILGDEDDEKLLGIGNPDVVEDTERLKLFLLPSEWRTVQREGVELDKIHYFHDILRNLYGKKGEDGKAKKYLIKRDPRRISPIYIFDPDLKQYFPIPYRDLTRPPMTLWELAASKKRCKEKDIADPNEQQIFSAYEELRQIRNDSVAKTKSARRERQAEKRRKKDKPVYAQDNNGPVETGENSDDKSEDVMSFYDDASLLDGVIVKNSRER